MVILPGADAHPQEIAPSGHVLLVLYIHQNLASDKEDVLPPELAELLATTIAIAAQDIVLVAEEQALAPMILSSHGLTTEASHPREVTTTSTKHLIIKIIEIRAF